MPNLSLVGIPEGDLCCGTAGTYNLEQPGTAHKLGERKARNILSTDAQVVVTGNIGCLVQLRAHLDQLGNPLPVWHTMKCWTGLTAAGDSEPLEEMHMAQHYTLEQARAALTIIRPLMERLMGLRDEILKSQPEMWPVIQKGAGNGGSKLAGEMAFRFKEVDEIVRRIQAMGVLIKDLNTGLVDFPLRPPAVIRVA